MTKVKSFVQKNYHYFFILTIVVFRAFYLMNGRGLGHEAADSGSYMNADLHLSALGKRVPIYPLFLKICKRMCRWNVEMGGAVATILQCIFSLMALWFMYQIFMMVTKNRLLSWITLTFYGCNAAILIWDCAIMTESLTMDAVVIFLYVILKYLKEKNFKWGCLAVIMSVVAAMVKPTCAVLTGVCLVLLVIQFIAVKDMRKTVSKLSLVLLLAILYYVAYCANTYRNYGTFNLTQLGPRHHLVTCLVTGTYKNYPDKELVAQIDEIVQKDLAEGVNIRRYPTTSAVMKLFGEDVKQRNIKVTEFNKYCKKTDPMAHLNFKIQNIKDFWNDCYESTDWRIWDYAIEYSRIEWAMFYIQKYVFSYVHIRFGFIMLFIAAIMTAVLWIKKKEIPWHWLGMSGTICILLYAVFANAYASFWRHTLFVLPFCYATSAMLIQEIIKKIQKKKKES